MGVLIQTKQNYWENMKASRVAFQPLLLTLEIQKVFLDSYVNMIKIFYKN